MKYLSLVMWQKRSIIDILKHRLLLGTWLLLMPSWLFATSLSWTGGAGNTDWYSANNWSSGYVPTAQDDVTIDANVTVSVLSSTPAINFNSLILGGSNTATLKLSTGTAAIGALRIKNKGTLEQNSSLLLNFASVVVESGGKITHTANSTVSQYMLNLNVAGDFEVQLGGQVFIDGKGFSGANGPGKGGSTSTTASGASYGGVGGVSGGTVGGVSYGSIINPVDLGSGGGRCGGPGGSGGGVLLLAIGGTLSLNGTISANGTAGTNADGGGSGGSINIVAQGLTGSGSVVGNGGVGSVSGSYYGGGGGGGRIRIIAPNAGWTGTMTTYGAGNTTYGGAGTTLLNGTLTINNNAHSAVTIASGSDLSFDNLVVENASTLNVSSVVAVANLVRVNSAGTMLLNSSVSASSMTILAGGVLTYGQGVIANINLSGDLTINSSAQLNANGKGYTGGNGIGKGSSTSTTASGASYGGVGGASGGTVGGAIYGSVSNPVDLGSGGGKCGGPGGYGGGAVLLNVGGILSLYGTISANGTAGTNADGGGSGGSINIVAQGLAGSGSIVANGGIGSVSGSYYGGGGGGGRIKIVAPDMGWTGTMTAYGAGNTTYGGAGTVLLNGTLKINNNAHAAATIVSGSDLNFDNMVVENSATVNVASATAVSNSFQVNGTGNVVLNNNLTTGSVTVKTNGILTYGQNAVSAIVTTGDVLVEAGGQINADGKGYIAANGPGKGSSTSTTASGAGYGGVGGQSGGTPGGSSYGSMSEPTDLGSGGGKCGGPGGYGGGAVLLNVGGILSLYGTISANGTAGTNADGGGSGGSINIRSAGISGTGVMRANGGNGSTSGSYKGGGGAGGRISLGGLSYPVSTTIQVSGGTGYATGGAGTIYDRDFYSPAMAVVRSTGSLVWSWGAKDGAVNYQLYIATDGALSPLLSASTLSYPQAGLSPNTIYTNCCGSDLIGHFCLA